MVGIVKVTGKGVVCKNGFKYVRFSPQMTLLRERGVIQYRSCNYEFSGSSFRIEFDSNDIVRESMSSLTIKNCRILNSETTTGVTYSNGAGQRRLVLNSKYVPYPVVSRRGSGPSRKRTDTVAYNDKDCMIFKVTWDTGRNVLKRELTGSHVVENEEDTYWNELEKYHTELFEFLKPSLDSPHFGDVVNDQLESNVIHLRRFSKKYNDCFMSHGIDLNSFKSLDVIDLNILNEIRIGDVGYLKQYPIIDIGRNNVIVVGKGLSISLMNSLEDGKYYYLLIGNSHYHRIHADSHTVLVIDTEIYEELDTAPMQNDLLFLKFNKIGLQKYTKNMLIDKLK